MCYQGRCTPLSLSHNSPDILLCVTRGDALLVPDGDAGDEVHQPGPGSAGEAALTRYNTTQHILYQTFSLGFLGCPSVSAPFPGHEILWFDDIELVHGHLHSWISKYMQNY